MPDNLIAVDGVPARWATSDFIKKLAKLIMCNFTCLGFDKPPKPVRNPFKTFYVKLPHTIEPYETIDKINIHGLQHGIKKVKVTAYIPIEIPDQVRKQKAKQVPLQLKRFLQIREELEPDKLIIVTLNELLIELQSKYTELYNLSSKNDHKLLKTIRKVILSRLQEIMEKSENSNGFELSKNYRKVYPHFGDFELILYTFKQIVPGGYINKKDLTNVTSHPYSIDQVPFDKIQTVCLKYSKSIAEKVNEHLASLKTDIDMAKDSEEEVARKKVRAELKKLTPYMNAIVKQVIVENFIPRKSPFHRIRIYGEPFMPSKEVMQATIKRYHPVKVTRSDRMFNLLLLNIPPAQYSNIIALDGTNINGCTLIVRSSDMPNYIPGHEQEPQDHVVECPEDEGMDEEYGMDVGAEDFVDAQDY